MDVGKKIMVAVMIAVTCTIYVSCAIADKDCRERGGIYAQGVYGWECFNPKESK